MELVESSRVTDPVRAFRKAGPVVFDYSDYRQFLRDFVRHLGATRASGFTQAKLAKAIGFASHAGLAMVMSGKRELREPYLGRCVKFLDLGLKERLFFDALVRASEMGPARKRALLREMQLYSAAWDPPEPAAGIRLLDLGLVHQILTLSPRFLRPEEIRARFRYGISPAEVARILGWMEKKGYVETERGLYRIRKNTMLAPDEKVDAGVRQLHRDCLRLAANAIDSDDLERREFQSYFFTMDSKRIPELKQRLKKLVFGIISEFESDLDADTSLQVHCNMFELLNRDGTEKTDKN